MFSMDLDIQKIVKAAEAGGEILRQYFGRALDQTQKSAAYDFLTEADLASEKTIVEILSAEFPDFNIMAEEQGLRDKKSAYTFVVDPLDGTYNFVLGYPNFSVSIGLFKDNFSLAGAIHAPMVKQTFFAEKGRGAFSDGTRLRVSTEKDISRANVAFGISYAGNADKKSIYEFLGSLNCQRAFFNWSPAYDFCLLASGKIEGFVSNNLDALHDYAAAKVICREAGAIITDFAGHAETDERNSYFVASNCLELHEYLLAKVRNLSAPA